MKPTAPFGVDVICSIIPQREPFLMLDEVLRADEDRVEAVKTFAPDLPVFRGHFPGNPVVPGVLLVEAMAQASLVLYHYNFDTPGLLYLTREETRFLRPALPGERLTILVSKIKVIEGGGMVNAEVLGPQGAVARGKLSFSSEGMLAKAFGEGV